MPVLVTPRQRAIWDRLKAEGHPYYLKVLSDGAKDNTTDSRYSSYGRWSALAYQMSGDPSFARRSYEHVKNSRATKDFATAAVLSGDDLREAGTELVITLDWIRDALTPEDVDAYKGWLFRMAEATLAGTIRMNDSDQVTGTYFYLAVVDRVFGTRYLSHPKSIAMREVIRHVCTVLAKGGQWPEGLDYSTGTLYLLFMGAEAAGMQDYPDVLAFRDELIRFFPHNFTPDLKDQFEHGDDQTPHDPLWIKLEFLLAYLGHYSAEIRQFEADLREVWKRPSGAPNYPRFFMWADPYGAKAPWRAFVGTYAEAEGRGQVYSRTGWADDAAALMLWFPPFSLGTVDHDYRIFGDFRFYAQGAWQRDRPVAYSSNIQLANHTIIAGLGTSWEIGAMTGAARLGDRVTYGSGTNAGLLAGSARYQPPPTLLHERSRSFVWLMDRKVIVVIERIHLDAVANLGRYAETAAQKAIAEAAPPIQTLWQSQTVMPVVTDGVIDDDGRVQPLYPATFTVIDQSSLALGSIHLREKKWHTVVTPTNPQPFQILNTLVGQATATVELLGDVQRIRVTTPGFPDAVIYSSAKVGPTLMTTTVGSRSVYDHTKINGILAARAVTIDPEWAEAGADVYVEQADGLVQLSQGTPGTEPPPVGGTADLQAKLAAAQQAIATLQAQLSANTQRLEGLESELAQMEQRAMGAEQQATAAAQQAAEAMQRAAAAEAVLRGIRDLVLERVP